MKTDFSLFSVPVWLPISSLPKYEPTIYLRLPMWHGKEGGDITSSFIILPAGGSVGRSTKYTSRFTIQQWIIDIDGQLNIYLPLRRF